MHNGIVTHAWPILPRPPAPPRAAPAPAPSALPEITPAPPVPAVPAPPPANAQMPYPLLDAELRDLLARCMAQQPADRPSLPALLRTVQDAVSTRTAAWYSFPPPDDRRETADGIRDFVRRAVYDAPEQPAGNG
ncbi:hypothetical protein UCREL1_8013 [Eutypa lata UCREL1]|uniref:Uncharacterized protein n=1 Tax=Eutypa lata (strain UCR-EL1) TaxID=1287681 RepID=M7SFG0_EUTLA|nr:hypothetical protein UCREL1_8013 [Eutypa lata UCREL1]